MGTRLDYMKISPDGVKALGGVYSYVKQCGLDETLVELVFLRTSEINGCAYCIDVHRATTSQPLSLLSIARLNRVLAQHLGDHCGD